MAKILIIDDDELVRSMLHQTLIIFGHEVSEARNGTEGLEQFRQHPTDIVITDIVMPETEGFEVLMELRKQHPPVKIVAISGGGRFTAGDYLQTAKIMGASRVLAKPFSSQKLRETVDELLAEGNDGPSSPPEESG